MSAGQGQANRTSWSLAAPALALLLIGSIGPLLIVLVYSFMTPGDYSGVQRPFTTQAWEQVFLTRDIFDDTLGWADAHMTIFWRSVKLSVLTAVITFLLGLPTAWFIATRPPDRRALWLFLITIPFWTNLLIRTIAINEIIRNEGLLNQMLLKLGVIGVPLQILYTDTAVLIGMAYVYLPMMVLPMYAAIDRFDTRLLEAAYDLFANRWQALWHVVLPVIRPGILAGSILVFVPSLGAYVTPRVLGGGKNMMIGNFIELQFGQGQNWPLGAALAVLLLIVVGLALTVYVRVLGGAGRADG
ncbi:ABC transporter permease [Paracoccus sp. R12_1]|uniref:ABC transporter permease n=1 Tax=unclassified Paracoccus (in: a-proteobacteria) TaxID=2688777 RepID=UPI001AD961E0|nr:MULTISPECIES: ABC transporter permease [unclassified Paracoccus (in: a-proteobacteria)]MBO9457146.1 ABC transporter permease [Paracoccus sp. R12_2]MBO9488425.1 ABC transporter permease [Paracoccus sp. R12_1]